MSRSHDGSDPGQGDHEAPQQGKSGIRDEETHEELAVFPADPESRRDVAEDPQHIVPAGQPIHIRDVALQHVRQRTGRIHLVRKDQQERDGMTQVTECQHRQKEDPWWRECFSVRVHHSILG